MRSITILILAMTLAACSGEPAQAVYDGIRIRNESLKKPEDRAATPQTPSYDQYKKERERIEQDDAMPQR